MEFQLKSDLNTGLQTIDFNYEALKQDIAERMDAYKGLVVTEDGIRAAKEDRARLNKLAVALDEERKRIGKRYMAPYDAFKKKIDELIALVKEPIAEIDAQTKAFDEKKKAEKRAALQTVFDENVGEFADLLRFDAIFDPRWLNATFKLSEAEAIILSVLDDLRKNVAILKEMHVQYETEALTVLFETRSMSAALQRSTQLVAQAQRIEAAQKELEEDSKRAATPAPSFAPDIAPASAPVPSVEVVDFRVWLTPAQKEALRKFLVDNHIRFGKVPENR